MSIETQLIIRNGLQFGLPLENAFQTKLAVDPALLNTFKQAYDCVVNSGYSVTTVISLQGTLNERVTLKERIALCTDLINVTYPPGAFLWVIRHYLGLLPVQILPKRIGYVKFVWWKIGKKCKRHLQSSYFAKSNNDTELTYRMINELLRLPTSNFLLLTGLLNFLRTLSVLPKGEPTINKQALFALVKYYTSSVFVRPFRPETRTKNVTQYYPLLLYLILKWPDIQSILIETNSSVLHMPLKNYDDIDLPKISTKSSTQIISKLPSHGAKQTNSKDNILRVIPDWYKTCEFVRDSCCQTDGDQKENLQFKLKSNKQICCCCVLKKRRNERFEGSPNRNSFNFENSKKNFYNANFFNDDYSRRNLISKNYENVKYFDPYVKIDTPTRQNKVSVQKKQLLSSYRVSNDIQEAVNQELKEKFAVMWTKHANNSDKESPLKIMKQTDSTKQDLKNENSFPSTFVENSLKEIPLEITSSNKSLISLKKIRSKFEFLRVFKSSCKTEKKFSLAKVESEIKYQKF